MSRCTCAESWDRVCPACIERFAQQLGDVPALLAELDVTAANQGRRGSLTGGRSKATSAPLPFNEEASDLARDLRWNLINGALRMQDDEGLFMHRHPSAPRPTVGQAIGYQLGHLDWFADREGHGPDVIEWLQQSTQQARRMILGPADRWFAGVCGAALTPVVIGIDVSTYDDLARTGGERVLVPYVQVGQRPTETCGERLFAELGRPTVRCRSCGASYPVEARRAQLVAEAEQALLPIDTILAAMPLLIGAEVNRSTARAWRRSRPNQAQRLFPVRIDLDGRELFWVGEVVTLARAAQARAKPDQPGVSSI